MKLLQINLFRFSLISILLCALQYEALAQTVLLVTDINGTLNTEESARKSAFEGWGYTVTTIHDNADQSTYDSAITLADIVYVPGTIDDYQLLYKLRTAPIGVITETQGLDTEFGYASSDGYTENHTQINIIDNSHPVSSGVSSGYLTIFNSNQPRTLNGNTLATGMTTLGMNGAATMLTLGVIDAGGTLANTYNSNSTASGRRVRMPWSNITWSALNSSGLSIVQNALSWAAGGSSNELVAHWKLDETSGTTASDSSGNGHDGSFYGSAAWSTEGRRNGSVDVDGAERINVPAFDVGGSELTLAAWVKPENLTNEGRLIMKSSNNTSAGQSWGMTIDDSGAVDFRVDAGGTWDRIIVSNMVSEGDWCHLLGTYDGTTMRVYVNGVLVGTESHSTGGALSEGASDVITIGDSPIGDRQVDGLIDDVRVYNYALNESQIAEVHGLIAHWKLDETSGATAEDSTIASNDATRTGTESWTTAQDGGGHEFDYTNGEDYFEAPSNTLLNEVNQANYTIMAYVKPNTLPPGTGSSNDATYGILIQTGWHSGLSYDNNGEFGMTHYLTGETWSGTGTYGTAYNPGQFYHVAGVVDKAAGTVKIYVNGTLVNTSNFTPGADGRDYSSNPWRIGIAGPGYSSWGWAADAVIDDVRIYNRALSDDEISAFAVAGSGLIAHWTFDEGSGTTVADSSGNGNDASFNTGSPSWTTGVYDGAIEFNGSNDIDTNSNFDPPATGSVAFWFKPSGLLSSTERLFGTSNSWEVRMSSSGRLFFDISAGGGPDASIDFTSSSSWYHAVFNYDSDADTYEIYINGELNESGSYSLSDQSAALLSFGTRTGSPQRFAGSLDDFRVYDKQLTAIEVSELYGLIGHWSFDEGSGSTISDSSALVQHASFTSGSPTWTDGIYGSALEFDGIDDEASTSASVDPPEKGSVSFWLRSNGTPSSRQRPWGLGGDFEIWQDTDGLISFDVSTDGYQGGFISDERLDTAGYWYHLVAQYDSDSDSYEIYVNGELHKSGVSTWNIQKQTANILTFGTRTGSSQRYAGALDEFRLYNRWLTVGEINDLYGRMAYWKLDETSGTTAVDATLHGNDGSYTGGPTLGVNGAFSANTATAVSLDGSSEYIDTNNSIVNDLSAFTMLGWIRTDDVEATQSFFGQNDAIEMGINFSSGRMHLWTENGGSLNAYNQLPVGKWTHVAVTGDGSDLKIYVNGRETISGGNTTANYGNSSDAFMLGAGVYSGSGDYLDGRLDDVQVFDRALKPEQIYNLYKGGRPAGVRILNWLETR